MRGNDLPERPVRRRVCVTRVGPDVFLVVVGDAVLALSWLETAALAGEAAEATGLAVPWLNEPDSGPDDGG